MRHKAFLTLQPHARKQCACKMRAVRCGLYTHRILIPYQAMFGSFSVPHLALHLATSLPGRKLWMSSSRVHCSIEVSVATLGQVTPPTLHCLHHFQLVRVYDRDPCTSRRAISRAYSSAFFFRLLHLRHDGRNCHTQLMAPHFRPRRAEPQPNRTQAVKHSFQDCRSVGYATTIPKIRFLSCLCVECLFLWFTSFLAQRAVALPIARM